MKKIILLCSSILICLSAQSQTNTDSSQTSQQAPPPAKTKRDTRPMKERLDFGFGCSLWFTANQTYLEVAPVVAYRFPKRLITGLGYRYIYRHSRVYGRDLNAYGPHVFARLNLLKRVYAWTEYETLQDEYLTESSSLEVTKNKTTVDSWFAGLGYVRSVGKRGRGGISIQVLYNFLYENDGINPYYSPVTYRVGYFF